MTRLQRAIDQRAPNGHNAVMVQLGQSRRGEDFTCPHCGAIYATRYTRVGIRDSDSALCQVCNNEMIRWNDTHIPSFELKKRLDIS